MAQKTGINFERCNVNSATLHNSRNKAYMEAVNKSPNKHYEIFETRTKLNASFIHPDYVGKELPKLLDDMRELYKIKVGQAPQEKDRVRTTTDKKTGMKKETVTPGWSPIREGVCPIKPDTKLEDFDAFRKWLEKKGPKVIRIDLHRDEGHTDPLTGELIVNNHAHIIVDWLDHDTGKTYKLNKDDASEMQTQIALSLGMERGESKTVTGRDHLGQMDYREKAIAESIQKLETMQAEVTEALAASCQALQAIGQDTVKQFDGLIRESDNAVPPTDKEKEARDRLQTESSDNIASLSNEILLKKTKTLRTLTGTVHKAIERIGKKLQKLAADLPNFSIFGKGRILAMKAEVEDREAAALEAENRARETQLKAEEELKAAREDKANVRRLVENAEKAARKDEYQKACRYVKENLDDKYNEGVAAGQKSSRKTIDDLTEKNEELTKQLKEANVKVKSTATRNAQLETEITTLRKLNQKNEAKLRKYEQTTTQKKGVTH